MILIIMGIAIFVMVYSIIMLFGLTIFAEGIGILAAFGLIAAAVRWMKKY